MTEIIRKKIYDKTKDHIDHYSSLDFDLLRRDMLTLFEAAAQAVQVAGYEQDDAVIDRFVVMCVGHQNYTLPVENMSTKELFKKSIGHQLMAQVSGSVDDVEIVSLRVIATLERWRD